MTHSIIDHGEQDFLTPKPTDVDLAIARACRISLGTAKPTTLAEQLAKNGLIHSADPFAWLRDDDTSRGNRHV